jgi:hypothetical protein
MTFLETDRKEDRSKLKCVYDMINKGREKGEKRRVED